MDGRATLDFIFKIADADTMNADFQFGRGVYDYFASVIPEKYPIVRPMMVFFPNAEKERGLRNLMFTAEEGHFIQTEAIYFLLQINLTYEKNFGEAIKYSNWLRTAYPQNAFFHALEGRVYATWSRWGDAVEIFRSVAQEYEKQTRGYNRLIASQAFYYIGRSEMLSGELDEAIVSFDRVLEISDAIPAVTYFELYSTLRRGMILDIIGNRNEALQEYEKVLDLPNQGDAHKRAKRYRRAPYGGSSGTSGA